MAFTNNSNGVSYVWDFDDGSAISNATSPSHTFTTMGSFNVSLIATDSSTCNIADTTYINITVGTGNPVIADFSHLQNANCDLFEVNTTNLSAGDNLTFQWNMGDASIYLDSNVLHQYSSMGTYLVTLVAQDSLCNNSDTATALITMQASIDVDIGDDQVICPYDQPIFDAGPGFTYLWNTGDTTQTISPLTAGDYSVTVFDGVCETADTVSFSFTNYVSRAYSTEICIGEMVILDAGDAQSYLWSNNETSQLVYVENGGDYWVQYMDFNGCSYEDTITVIENEASVTLFVPNAFSPFADGINDTWSVVGEGVENYELYVYGRWGELVWSSTNIDDQWDGTYKGSLLPIDVYAYVMSYSSPCLGKKIIQKSGHVVIVK